MHRIATFAAAGLALAGCATSTTSIAQGAYALGAALDTAEKAELLYEDSPAANAATVARIKLLDAAAYAAIAPLVANGNNATADELTAAQAALSALTQYLTASGAK